MRHLEIGTCAADADDALYAVRRAERECERAADQADADDDEFADPHAEARSQA